MRLREMVESERQDLTPQPAFKCFNPQRVFNPYLGEHLFVDCRKCDACLHKKSVELTNRVTQECKQHKYSLFVTLTYDNEHLPLFKHLCDDYFVSNKPFSFDGRNYHYPSFAFKNLLDADGNSFECDPYDLQPTNLDVCGFAYASKYDMQKFLKRLRIRLSRSQEQNPFYKATSKNKLWINKTIKDLPDYEKKIRYFFASEYGPTTLRPHYHGIIWTDNEQVARWLERNISTCWSMCDTSRVDVQYVSGSAPQYVAKYCNSFNRLPKILQTEFTKPFYLASKNPVIGSYKSDVLALGDALINGTIEQLEQRTDDKQGTTEFAFVPISKQTFTRYFPTYQGFGLPLDYGEFSLLEKYRKGNFKRKYKIDENLKARFSSALSMIHEHYKFDYVLSDDFCYQDKHFVDMVDFWTSRPIEYPERVNGVLTGRVLTTTLSDAAYLVKLHTLYDNYRLYVLRNFYLSQEVGSEKFPTRDTKLLHKWFLLSFYREFVFNLPLHITENEYVSAIEDLYSDEFCLLRQLGVNYWDLYSQNTLMPEFQAFIKFQRDCYSQSFRSEIYDKILDSIKTKKSNEILNDSLNNNFNINKHL